MKRAASVIDECFAVAINAEPAKPAKSKHDGRHEHASDTFCRMRQ
jgi:hypothetical protein